MRQKLGDFPAWMKVFDLAFPEIFLVMSGAAMGSTDKTAASDTTDKTIDEVNYDRRFVHPCRSGHIVFDSEKGVGAVPDNMDVAYAGFAAILYAQSFLLAAAKLDPEDRSTRTLSYLPETATSVGWGPPRIYLRWNGQHGRYQVDSHEGRHRALTALKLGCDKIPVHIFIRNKKASKITPADLDSVRSGVLQEESGVVVPLYFDTAFLGNQRYVYER